MQSSRRPANRSGNSRSKLRDADNTPRASRMRWQAYCRQIRFCSASPTWMLRGDRMHKDYKGRRRLSLLLLPTLTLLGQAVQAASAVSVEEVEVRGRAVNLVGSATSASEGRISRAELALRPLLRTGD